MLIAMRLVFIACFFIVFSLFVITGAAALDSGHVTHIVDGDTVVVDGHSVRLLGINTPEKARGATPAEPGAKQATEKLRALLTEPDDTFRHVRLAYDTNKTDRYDRLLAHLYLTDGTWVNRVLVAAGVAHVYSFPDNRAHVPALLKAEKQARAAGKNMWQHPDWQVLAAKNLTPDGRIGQFRLVKGKPLKAAKVNKRIYLNYGADWRTDFTVEIPKKFWPLFENAGINPLTHYSNKTVVARGRLKPVNGVLITVTHPAQLQLLSSGDSE